jgi:hypothetical protein
MKITFEINDKDLPEIFQNNPEGLLNIELFLNKNLVAQQIQNKMDNIHTDNFHIHESNIKFGKLLMENIKIT